MENIGRNIRVHLKNGETVEGWVYAETWQAVYVALDINGDDIRLIPCGRVQRTNWSDENPSMVIKARWTESKLVNQLKEQIDSPLKDALGKINQNHISDLGQSFKVAKNELMHFEHSLFRSRDDNALKTVKNAFEMNNVLRYELSRTAIDSIILEHTETIRKIVSPLTIPLIDGHTNPQDIEQLIQLAKEHDYISETNLGKSYIDMIKPDDIMELDKNQEKEQTIADENNRPRNIRKISAGLKIASGGLMAVSNVAIGSLVGIISTLPTLGIGAVAASVGIAASIHTGINTTCEGLKDLATVLEDKKESRIE